MPTYAAFAPAAGEVQRSPAPLLATTPPTVTKAISQIYPFICFADRLLALLTWTSDDKWQSFLLVVLYAVAVKYFEFIVLNLGHLVVAAGVALVVLKSHHSLSHEPPSLDSIVLTLSKLSARINLFLMPLSGLNLSKRELTRFLFAAAFMTPLYFVVTHFLLSVRSICLWFGLYVLTYHSAAARTTRGILWRWRIVRVVVFYLTTLNFNSNQLHAVAQQASSRQTSPAPTNAPATGGKNVRFTYVLFENQRRWLGIGWTSNMLAYERAPWTDEFLNEATSPEVFKLPDSEGTGMVWRWVDVTWNLDLSNDGSLAPKSKVILTPDPGEEDGYVYYDNMWKRPSAEYSYSKYTRRRRWVRMAELVTLHAPKDEKSSSASAPDSGNTPNSTHTHVSAKLGTTATEEAPQPRRRTRFVE